MKSVSSARACGLTVMAISVTVPAGPARAQADTYSATIGAGALLSDPLASAVEIAHGRLLVADRNNDAVLVYDTTTLAHIATIGVVGVAVPLDNIHLNQPSGVCVDATNDHILAVDGGDERVQIYDAKSLAYVATIGEPNVAGIDNAHFGRPVSVKINPVSGQIYVATLGIQPSDAEYNPLTNQIMIADPIWRGRCARHGRSRRSLDLLRLPTALSWIFTGMWISVRYAFI